MKLLLLFVLRQPLYKKEITSEYISRVRVEVNFSRVGTVGSTLVESSFMEILDENCSDTTSKLSNTYLFFNKIQYNVQRACDSKQEIRKLARQMLISKCVKISTTL